MAFYKTQLSVATHELALQYSAPEGASEGVIICHPHPLYSGTMDNKVVHTVAKARDEQGWVTVRFNFRGVGQSTGEHDHGVGEADDVLAVLDWAQAQFPHVQKWHLAGFSFGAMVARRVADSVEWASLQLIAPPVDLYEMPPLTEMTCPVSVLIPGKDEVIDARAQMDWVQQAQIQPTWVVLGESSHFFHKRLIELKRLVQAF